MSKFNTTPCRWGHKCIHGNCWFKHPVGHEPPTRINYPCIRADRCTRVTCLFMHPKHTPIEFKARYIYNKENEPPVISHNFNRPCRYGPQCKHIGSGCCFRHIKKNSICPFGIQCNRQPGTCLYEFHTQKKIVNKKGRSLVDLVGSTKPPENNAAVHNKPTLEEILADCI